MCGPEEAAGIGKLELWKASIEERNDGNYSDNAKPKMFISWQSYEGLQVTVFSFKEVCKFLLHKVFHIFCLKHFVKMIWKIILGNSVSLAKGVII